MCDSCTHWWCPTEPAVPCCNNPLLYEVKRKRNKPDPYECEFFDPVVRNDPDDVDYPEGTDIMEMF